MSEFTNEQKQPFLREGRLAERAFANLLDNPKFSSSQEDQLEHWDVKFDVKGLKKVKRSDSETNEHIHWVEILGITGHNGWAYGEADFFAFELQKYWVIVAKQDLQSFISENVVKEFTHQPTLYKLYRRQGRQDIITMVTSYDLCFISSAILKKK
jgi:hypothetical protein